MVNQRSPRIQVFSAIVLRIRMRVTVWILSTCARIGVNLNWPNLCSRRVSEPFQKRAKTDKSIIKSHNDVTSWPGAHGCKCKNKKKQKLMTVRVRANRLSWTIGRDECRGRYDGLPSKNASFRRQTSSRRSDVLCPYLCTHCAHTYTVDCTIRWKTRTKRRFYRVCNMYGTHAFHNKM